MRAIWLLVMCLTAGLLPAQTTQMLTVTAEGGSFTSFSEEAGVSYVLPFAGSGGVPPYTYSIIAGQLPGGETLSATSGAVSGTTPNAAGQTYQFTVQVQDAASNTATLAVTVGVIAATSIVTQSLSTGTVGVAYSYTLAATGGYGGYAWSIVAGSLPAGLALASSTGIISGTPSTHGVFSFNVDVTDGFLQVKKALSITINPACTPGALVVTPSSPTSSSSFTSGFPVPLSATVADNCGNPVGSATVVATFSNGDSPVALALQSPASGTYSGTWTPTNVQSQTQVTVTFTATSGAFGAQLTGMTSVTVTLSKASAPIINTGGIVDAFSPQVGAALSPGDIVAIYGTSLSTSTAQAAAVPLPTTLGGASVRVGGMSAPLFYASPTQINAMIPYSLPTNTPATVFVLNNGAASNAVSINTTVANPGVASFSDGTIIATHLDGSLVFAASPAAPGEIIVIYCTGLGPTNPTVTAGTAAPVSPLAQTSNTAVTIGNLPATVLFSGLTPGEAGLYQIDLTVPASAPAGNLQLVVNAGSIASSPVILPVN